jgi:peptidoglycan-associated lipoprotein
MATRISQLGTGLLLALGTTLASAQSSHPVSVGASYTYVRTNILPGCNCFSLNGGGAQVQVGMTRRISLLAEVTVTHAGGITADQYDLGQVTYTFGPRLWIRSPEARLQPFGEIKLGAAHDFGSLSPERTFSGGGANAFAFETGGGLEVRLRHRISLVPVEANYLLTTFHNGVDNRQNDLRLSAGVMFRIRR